MEAVETPRQEPPLLALLEIHQAHRAIQLGLLSRRGVDEDRQRRKNVPGGGGVVAVGGAGDSSGSGGGGGGGGGGGRPGGSGGTITHGFDEGAAYEKQHERADDPEDDDYEARHSLRSTIPCRRAAIWGGEEEMGRSGGRR
ncbi:hypothetical protein Cni_G19067 [Canna indica]|uniref:Uncharacterized protein n=1 Tax=Canna indica TaxID=4628 RepID=A0AAQ3KMF0_9LILI|nr:hypothetical protein Cni_G19067 [Canna indica]